jgi:hypothetical protein
MLTELNKTVAALSPADLDAAQVEILRAYAREIDGAKAAEAKARKLAEQVAREHGTDSALYERVSELAAQLTYRGALATFGKALQAGLVQARATRKSRPAGDGPDAAARAAESPLGKLRVHQGGKA